MENNFEKLFEANRGAFEKEEPEAGIWHNLSGKLQEYHTAKQRQQKLWMTKWVAAAILLLMAGAAALIFIPGKRQNAIAQQDKKNIIPPAGMQQPVEEDTGATKDKTVMEKTPAPIGPRSAVAQLDEPGEIKYYRAAVKLKEQQVDKLLANVPGLEKDFKHALKDLNEITRQLQAALPQSVDKGKVIDGIIKNLQMQENILNSQLQALQELQNSNANDKVHD